MNTKPIAFDSPHAPVIAGFPRVGGIEGFLMPMKTYEEQLAGMTLIEMIGHIAQSQAKQEHREALSRVGRVLSTMDDVIVKLLCENRKLKGEQNGR